MLGPSRHLPKVGSRARIAQFGGGFEPALVVAVLDGGRRLHVQAHDGELREFVLQPATAKFVHAGRAGGERLELLE